MTKFKKEMLYKLHCMEMAVRSMYEYVNAVDEEVQEVKKEVGKLNDNRSRRIK